jgi:Mn2+/Fe2+ NRAMP family transporter
MTSFDNNPKMDALIKQGLKKSTSANFTDSVMQRIHAEKKSVVVSTGMDYSKFVLAIVLCLAALIYVQQKQLIELPKISGQFMGVASIFFSALILLLGVDKLFASKSLRH